MAKDFFNGEYSPVSTHSRPKAAGNANGQVVQTIWFQLTAARRRLAYLISAKRGGRASFNSQPPEGGWATGCNAAADDWVSTHSRPKAAGITNKQITIIFSGFNSQPPEGGWLQGVAARACVPGFNSQPPEGGW